MEEKIKQIRLKKALAKLDGFTKLEKNWFDPEMKHGEPISRPILNKLKNLLEDFYIIPEVFPLCDGGIQIEWSFSNNVYMEVTFESLDDFDSAYVFIMIGLFSYEKNNQSLTDINKLLKEMSEDTLDLKTLEKYSGR